MNFDWKQFAKYALLRAIRTFAQTFASTIAVGAAFSEVAWLKSLSISGVAFVLSILTSLATGLPEVEFENKAIMAYGMNPDADEQACPPPPKGE